ncbi:hypothetical protein [Brevundimonas subvibrioides]|uniref:hypothetical protein n=1 Tax=Brevundimonas subvibrioides TaxID=74313 RepID=UPI0022B483FE|nr:hypothetical protein [Brevundimonas subvibrioides]
MTEQYDKPVPRKRGWVSVIWWILTGVFILWAIQAGSQHNIVLAAGFLTAAILVAPTVQKMLLSLPGLRMPGWAVPITAIGIAVVAIAVSPPSEVATAPASSPSPASRQAAVKTPADTLSGRVSIARDWIDILIRDDLNTKEGHRDDYETPTLRNELTQAEDWGTLAFEGLRAQRASQEVPELRSLMTRAATYQRREFPRYRLGYAKQAYGKIWQNDIKVQARGERNSTLRLTGLVFAANRNIGEMHREIEDEARRLRFKRIEYATFDTGEYQYFDLEVPADEEVGVWVGNEFMSASAPGPDEEATMLVRPMAGR